VTGGFHSGDVMGWVLIIILGLIIIGIVYVLILKAVHHFNNHLTKKQTTLKLKTMTPQEILADIRQKIERQKKYIIEQKNNAGSIAGVGGADAFVDEDKRLLILENEENVIKKVLQDKGFLDKENFNN